MALYDMLRQIVFVSVVSFAALQAPLLAAPIDPRLEDEYKGECQRLKKQETDELSHLSKLQLEYASRASQERDLLQEDAKQKYGEMIALNRLYFEKLSEILLTTKSEGKFNLSRQIMSINYEALIALTHYYHNELVSLQKKYLIPLCLLTPRKQLDFNEEVQALYKQCETLKNKICDIYTFVLDALDETVDLKTAEEVLPLPSTLKETNLLDQIFYPHYNDLVALVRDYENESWSTLHSTNYGSSNPQEMQNILDQKYSELIDLHRRFLRKLLMLKKMKKSASSQAEGDSIERDIKKLTDDCEAQEKSVKEYYASLWENTALIFKEYQEKKEALLLYLQQQYDEQYRELRNRFGKKYTQELGDELACQIKERKEEQLKNFDQQRKELIEKRIRKQGN